MNLHLTTVSTSILKDLNTLYNCYLNERDDHLQYVDGQCIYSILISIYTSLYEVPLEQLNKVYVKKSPIEGLGVFSKENIRKGEIVTIYPSDIVRIHNKGNKYYEFCSDRPTIFYEKYAYKTAQCIISGDATHIKDMNLVGHIVNDGCYYDPKINNEYHTKNNNCIYYPYRMFVLIVASKDIKKGEELLVSYGIDYWKNIHL